MPENLDIEDLPAPFRAGIQLTQEMLAEFAGVSRYSVQALEAGTGATKISSVLEIADVLGLRLDVKPATE